MAQLKDLIVTGATRLIGNAYAGTVQLTTLNVPTTAGGTTYGPGTNGYVLKSNGSSVYWGSDNNSVTGVKGNAESSYRTGQVNLTPANIGALALTGGTMTGAINLVGNQSSAWNDKGLVFTNGSRIGENTTGGLGIYAAERVYIRPNSSTSASADGIEVSNTGVIPSNNNTETLGDSSHKWSTVYATTFSGNAVTATKTGVAGIWLYPENNNELNIGGTNNSSTIYIGYRAKDSRPIPTKFIFGGSTGSADLQAKTVYLGSGTTSYISSTSYTGNAATATKLATARTISLTGSVTGSGSFDGSGNLSIATTTNHHHNTLTVGNKTYNGSSNVTIEIADLGLASTTTFIGLTSTNLSNGSTTNPVTITIGPTTGSVTATNGSVVMEADSGEEYIWSGNKWNLMGLASSWALANHIHGNITNAGTITSDTAKASGQHLVITDSNNKICRSAITLGTATNTYLRNDGSWATLGNAATATKLATARNINGTAFDGSTDITTANWGTARTITIGSTGKSVNGSADVSWSHNEIGASVSNTWANGTTAGPTLSTTVNGVTGTAVAIPNASDSASGIVTTGAQTFAGKKTFGYIGLKGKNNANEDVRYCSITLHNGAGTQVGEIYYDIGNATNITSGQYTFRQFSPNSTVNTSTTGFYENFQLPVVTAERTANATYQILTTKDYTTLDGRYVNIAGDTMTGDLYVSKSTPNVRCIDPTNNNLACSLSIGSGHQNHGLYSNGYAPSATTFTSSGKWIICRGPDGEAHSNLKIYGAVWNDYAEYRETKKEIEPGRCICETGKGDLVLTNKRMQEGCEIVSDTFGFAIGKSEKCKTPTAATGRVLAYLHEDRELAKPGRPVCSGPNGTVSLMTNEEAREYPWCIIGTVSEIPNYEIWHAGSNGDQEIKVNGRIWIRIR